MYTNLTAITFSTFSQIDWLKNLMKILKDFGKEKRYVYKFYNLNDVSLIKKCI